jgi:hypothetical protein
MEILIIGAIFVAIMAYVSTKIKRAASEAYEQENVETEHFRLIKPENFIILVKENSEFAFETYSKDYGTDLAEKFRQSWAIVREKDGVEFDTELLESKRAEENVTIKNFTKTLIDKTLDKSFELEISVLPEYEEKYADGIKLMLESFILK